MTSNRLPLILARTAFKYLVDEPESTRSMVRLPSRVLLGYLDVFLLMTVTVCDLASRRAMARIQISTEPPLIGGTGICSGATIRIFMGAPPLVRLSAPVARAQGASTRISYVPEHRAERAEV